MAVTNRKMEYIERMRLKLGHERILIPATAVAVLNRKQEVLLHLRNDSTHWGLPGGLMDLGETVVECAQRETREETGLSVRNLKLYGIFSGPRFENTYPSGDQTAPVILGFFTEDYEGELVTSEEALRLGFFPLGALPEQMNRFHRVFVETFVEYRSRGAAFPITL